MSSNEARQATMDATQVYREETFTDRKVGTIRRLMPVTADGGVDTTRPVIFVGQAQVMTPMGAVPISFELEAAHVAGASCPWKVLGAGCIAYSLTRIVAASPIRPLPIGALPHVCADASCEAPHRRLGLDVDGACLPFCTDDLAPSCTSCRDGLCHPNAAATEAAR